MSADPSLGAGSPGAAPESADVHIEPHPRTLDPVLHERLRLAIVVALAQRPMLTFSEVKAIVGLTDGNLSVHARRLEEVGYLEQRKLTTQRTTRTEFRLTPAGRRALGRYLDAVEAIARGVRPYLTPR